MFSICINTPFGIIYLLMPEYLKLSQQHPLSSDPQFEISKKTLLEWKKLEAISERATEEGSLPRTDRHQGVFHVQNSTTESFVVRKCSDFK